jgi:hypothetical protein
MNDVLHSYGYIFMAGPLEQVNSDVPLLFNAMLANAV